MIEISNTINQFASSLKVPLAIFLTGILILNFSSVNGSTSSDLNLIQCDKFPITFCDRNGLAYQYYGDEIGIQLNPLRTASKAMEYYMNYIQTGNGSSKTLLLNVANWIVDNSKSHGNYSLIEYNFPEVTYNLKPGWSSAISQGRAIEALIAAHNITHDERYAHSAKMLLNSFFIDTKLGGITYKYGDNGWWYEEYPSKNEDAEKPKVLNGMMSALLSIHRYFEYTHDSNARYLFDNGIISLEKNLPHYDNNGHSYYDSLGNNAKAKYHQIHVKYLQILYEITSKPIFKKYHDVWAKGKKVM